MTTALAAKCFRAAITDPDPRRAVRTIVEGSGTDTASLTFVFVDAQYDLDGLAVELRRQIRGPILACTTAGHQIAGSGVFDGGMVAAAIQTDQLSVTLELIRDVHKFGVLEAQAVATRLGLDTPTPVGAGTRFGVILIDGMSLAEERVMALLYGASNGLPIVGGSAGDGLRFGKTFVFDGERFVSDAAIFARVDTTLPCRTFGFQNFVPMEHRFVVTRACAERRQILELDGGAAVRVYGAAIGESQLDSRIVSQRPLLLRWDGRYYARGIRAWDDDRLDLFCAIEQGTVVRIGQSTDLVTSIEQNCRDLRSTCGSEFLIMVSFDCILRRLEIERSHQEERYRQVAAPYPLIGFYTYGEQHNGLHVNQTTTGFILGS